MLDHTHDAEEQVANLFHSDPLAALEYLETLCRKTALDPERKLMLAVLGDATSCFQRYLFAPDSKGKRLFQEAEEWVLGADGDWIFSFENICEALGFDPRYIRQGLVRWKEKKLAMRPKAREGKIYERGKSAAGHLTV